MNDKNPKYNKSARYAIGIALLLAYIYGIVVNPSAFWDSISRIPTAFSTMVTWLIFTGAIIWFLVDMASKYLLGKSLREHIADKDAVFERNLVIAMVVAIPITMLVAR